MNTWQKCPREEKPRNDAIAVVISSVIMNCLDVEQGNDVSNLPSVITGLVLILASLIFRCGTELEEQNRSMNSEAEKRDGIESGNKESF